MRKPEPVCIVFCTGTKEEPVWHRSASIADYEHAKAEAERMLAAGECLKFYVYSHAASVRIGLPEGWEAS